MKGYWSLPGGVVETGEKLEAAVRREVQEETGLELGPLVVFEIFERIIEDAEGKPEYHYVLIDYIGSPTGGVLRASSDASRVRWVRADELPNYTLTEGTLPVILRAFEKHATDQR